MADRQIHHNWTLMKKGRDKMPMKLIDEDEKKIVTTAFIAALQHGQLLLLDLFSGQLRGGRHREFFSEQVFYL